MLDFRRQLDRTCRIKTILNQQILYREVFCATAFRTTARDCATLGESWSSSDAICGRSGKTSLISARSTSRQAQLSAPMLILSAAEFRLYTDLNQAGLSHKAPGTDCRLSALLFTLPP